MKVISKNVGKDGVNKAPDVRAVQCLLNLDTNRTLCSNTEPRLAVSGKLDTATQDAITLFQKNALKIDKPDGRVDPGGGMINRLQAAIPALPNGAFTEPRWLQIAYQEEQLEPKEKKGYDDNDDRILEYLRTASGLATQHVKVPLLKDGKPVFDKRAKPVMTDSEYLMSGVDETAWCACFVNWCLNEAGEKPIPGARAEKYASWGNVASTDHVGAVCTIFREPFGDSGSGWHVGFFIGGSSADGYVALLGGNQGNKVCRKWFIGIEPKNIYLRWPRAS
jgi:uncharacterized protein (TIGR02594 family)